MTTKRLSIDGCITPPLKKILDRVAENAKVQEVIETNVNTLISVTGPGPTYLNGQPASYYLDFTNHTGYLTNASMPERFVKLQGAVTAGVASVKFYDWNGSAYVVTGSAFDVYDIYDEWAHGLTNDLGIIVQDRLRNVWVIHKLDSPLHRDVTIGSALTRDGTATGTDVTTAQTLTVTGRYVRTGRKIPTSTRLGVAWYNKPKKWYPMTNDVCDEVA